MCTIINDSNRNLNAVTTNILISKQQGKFHR